MTTRVPRLATAIATAIAAAAFATPARSVPAREAPPPAAAAAAPKPAPEPVVEVSYLYSLSTNFGTLPFSNAQLSYDRAHRELYVTGAGPVRVFNDSGMEVYTFGDDPELGFVYSIVSTEGGDLIALTSHGGKLTLVRCTFRGEFIEAIEPRDVPEPFAKLAPSIIRYANGKLYVADLGAMRIVVLDAATGAHVASFDVAEKLQEADHRADLGLRGFNVDREGNMLFTIQPLFKAYLMTLAGEIRAFGQKGSAPGKFNIVGGIARDDAGNLYVSDILKSAILVFDPDFVFRKEFGYRGGGPSNLAAPEDLAAAGNKLFVSQRARRGVSVFQVVRR